MKKKWIWILLIAGVTLVGAGYYFRANIFQMMGSQQTGGAANAQAQGNTSDAADLTTTTIRPATDSAQVSAAGNIEIAYQQPAVLQVEGIVTQIVVDVGDEVAVGDLLVALDTVDLERAVQRAELNLDAQRNQLDQLMEPADPAEIASARAGLVSAQKSLAETQAGPSATELAAAEASLTAAQERYQELLAGSSEAELTQASVDLHKKTIALKQAQEAYDEIAYKDNVGSSQQAMTLQEATIDYDAAKATYEIATEPPSEAELQDAVSAIESARDQLDSLRRQPTEADLAAAEAQVASAEAQLAQLLGDPVESDLRAAEIELEQTQLDLEEAEANLAQARLYAPIAGTVLSVDVEIGQRATSGSSAMSLADLTALELTVNVAEVDISKVQENQPAKITIDALPDRVFSGVVSRIAPASDSESGVVNYPVTIRLDNINLDGVRPGMTAVATISDNIMRAEWLVPTNSLREFEGETTVVVIRNGQRTRVNVTPGASQGEWTIVQSPDLQAGDEVVGQVASFLNEDEGGGGPRGPFGPPRR